MLKCTAPVFKISLACSTSMMAASVCPMISKDGTVMDELSSGKLAQLAHLLPRRASCIAAKHWVGSRLYEEMFKQALLEAEPENSSHIYIFQSAKKSLPLSSTMIKAGKSSTSIRQTASIPSSSYSTTDTFLMAFSAKIAAAPPTLPR